MKFRVITYIEHYTPDFSLEYQTDEAQMTPSVQDEQYPITRLSHRNAVWVSSNLTQRKYLRTKQA